MVERAPKKMTPQGNAARSGRRPKLVKNRPSKKSTIFAPSIWTGGLTGTKKGFPRAQHSLNDEGVGWLCLVCVSLIVCECFCVCSVLGIRTCLRWSSLALTFKISCKIDLTTRLSPESSQPTTSLLALHEVSLLSYDLWPFTNRFTKYMVLRRFWKICDAS